MLRRLGLQERRMLKASGQDLTPKPCARFASYANRYKGQPAVIVGKGHTEFDYAQLHNFSGVHVFINDAVTLAANVPDKHCFLFFLDRHQAVHWLQIKLPDNVTVACPVRFRAYNTGRNKCFYFDDINSFPVSSRSELASSPRLWKAQGTITSALHFVWYIGCYRVTFIGCDGINDRQHGYDSRLSIISASKPGWRYDRIRHNQDTLCEIFNLESSYIGTPNG